MYRNTCLPQCISSSPSGQKEQFLFKLTPWTSSSLRGQNVESYQTYRNRHHRAYSTPCGLRPDIGLLPQWISSSLLYTLRAPPRYWIAIAMDIVETQRPNSGQQIGIEGDCRGRSGTIVINESRKEKDNEINKHARAEAKPQPNISR